MNGAERLATTILITVMVGVLGYGIGGIYWILISEKMWIGVASVTAVLALCAIDAVYPYKN